MKTEKSTRRLARIAMIAAVYLLISIVFLPLSFGAIQIRIAEALGLLCVFSMDMVTAVTIGCALANLVGLLSAANPLVMDFLFGTLATFIAGILTYCFRNIRIKGLPVVSAIPPIIVNAIIIGAEFTVLETGGLFINVKLFIFNMFYIGIGQIIPCLVLGLILVTALERTGIAKKYLGGV